MSRLTKTRERDSHRHLEEQPTPASLLDESRLAKQPLSMMKVQGTAVECSAQNVASLGLVFLVQHHI